MNEIAQVTQICRNFPSEPLNEIERESQLDAIDKALAGAIQTVFVDGEQGIGKTTLLAQFMKRHEGNTIGVFITPISRLTYSRDYINTVVVEQLYWMFEARRFPNEVATSMDVQKMMLRLQKYAKSHPVYFVVDGLEDISVNERDEVTAYLFQDVLQLGLREFRYVVSGNKEIVKVPGADRIQIQVQQVYPFDRDQIRKYFNDFSPTDEDLHDLKAFSHGVPFRLEVALRWLEDGKKIADLFSLHQSKLVDLFELDWTRVDLSDHQKHVALAMVAFASRPMTIEKVAHLCGITPDALRQFYTSTRLIDIDIDTNDPLVKFRSEAQRLFAMNKLQSLQSEVQEVLLNDLIARPAERDSVLYLIDDLSIAGRSESVLTNLDNDHFSNVLSKEQSLSVLKRHASLGCKAAHKLGRTHSFLQFGLAESLLNELDGSFTSRAEVRALLKLGRNEEAISLACAADTKEDRFSLLATIGNHLVIEKLNFPSELREHISQAAVSIDLATLGNRASKIAEDIVTFDPDLAFKVLTSSSPTGAQQTDSDLKFAQFHMAVTRSGIGAPAKEMVQKRAREQIASTKIQELADVAATLLTKYDADQIIARVDRLAPQHRIYFLKTWLVQNASAANAPDVAEYALNFMLGQIEHTPKLSDFRAIAAVLPHMQDRDRAMEFTRSVESQKAVVPSHGTTEEYVRLQMILLQSDAVSDVPKAKDRAIGLYAEVDDIDDVGTKTACLAWMLHYMHDIKNLDQIDDDIHILSSVASQLVSAFDTLLLSTADHYGIAKRPIDALAKHYPNKAFDLAGRLNTQERRNKAYKRLIRAQLRSKAYRIDCTYLHKSVMSISTFLLRDHTIIDLMETVRKDAQFNLSAPGAGAILNLWKEAKGPEAKFFTLLNSYLTLKSKDAEQAEKLDLENRLEMLWDSIPGGWYKVYAGYTVVDSAALLEKTLAEKWLARAREEADRTIASSDELNKVISATTALAVRSGAGLIRMKAMSNSLWERLCRLIVSMPAGPDQIRVWTDLAIRCWFKGDKGKCSEITTKYIRPTIDNVSSDYATLRAYLITESSPALYLNHLNSADDYISTIPQEEQDEARGRICNCLFSQLSPYDPSPDQQSIEFTLDYDRAIDICIVLAKITTDSLLFSLISIFCDSLISKRNRATMTNNQKKTILDRLAKIINERLPDKLNIQHEGFRIAANAKMLRVREQVESVQPIAWQSLRDDADGIPNVADRAIVICIVAVQASKSNISNARSWLSEAKTLVNLIPSQYDRIDRYRWMGELAGKMNPTFCQSIVREAFELTSTLQASDFTEERQRQLLDLAHQYDPKLADELIELVDKDPARREVKGRLNSHVKVLNARKKIFAKETSQFDSLDDQELYELAVKNLTSLVYGRFSTCPMNEMLPMLRRAAGLSLSETMPMWCWFVENVNRRLENSSQEVMVVSDIFESVLNAAELAFTLVGCKKNLGHQGETSTTLFRNGERDAAYGQIKKWVNDHVASELLISDPYFGPDELDLIKMVQELKPLTRIRLLISLEHVKKYQIDGKSFEAVFQDKWLEISDQDPPRTDITVIGLKPSGKHPIHDRWFISGRSGLRVGTSVNSIGIGRTSEISSLSGPEASEREKEVLSYINRDVRDKISYHVIDL